MNKRGILLVVSGPSGVGKGTVVSELIRNRSDMYASVSATTRKQRQGEIDGVNYHFKTEEEFGEIKQAGGFLESAVFCGKCYGTLKSEVFERLEAGVNVVLEIEVQGALKVRSEHPESVLVYIYPPSMEQLRSRLVSRNTETEEHIKRRLESAAWELTQIHKYNYLIENDEVSKAAGCLSGIIDAEHVRVERCYESVKEKFL